MCMQCLVDDMVVFYDNNVDIPETISINPNDKTNYWPIAVVLLSIRKCMSTITGSDCC